MRSEKTIVNLFKKLIETVSEEYGKNAAFAAQIDQILDSPALSTITKKKKGTVPIEPIPNLYNERLAREGEDFSLWLSSHSSVILRATVRAYELDARKQTEKWKEPKKFADFIVEKLKAKSERGSAFLRTNENTESNNDDLAFPSNQTEQPS